MNSLIETIDHITYEVTRHFGNLNSRDLNDKPSASQWSIAQNLQHIIIVNESYLPVIKKLRNKSYKAGWLTRQAFLVKLTGKKILESVQPVVKKKIKTFEEWKPLENMVIEDIIPKFDTHQQLLKELILSSQDLIDAGTVIHSPVNRLIVYSLEDAFKIMVAHEERHLNQAKEVLFLQLSERLNIV